MSEQRYAIVIGGSHFNPLGIVRSLGESKIKSVFVNMSQWGFAENSKYTLETIHTTCEEDIINAVKNTIKKYGGRPAIFPSCDYSAKILDKHYEELKDISFCPGCKGKLAHFMKKEVMCELARESGFIVPETQYVNVDENFISNLKKFKIPFIIKPISNFQGSKSDIKICKDLSEIEKLAASFISYNSVLVQRYVEGNNNLMVEYCGCKSYGNEVCVYGQLEKIREYPTGRGSTSYAVIKKNMTFLDKDNLSRLLDLAEFSGVFDLELKVVDGMPYFIEINFRNGAPAYSFTKYGFNLHSAWYNIENGMKSEPDFEKEITLICEGIDLNHVFTNEISLKTWIKIF